VIHDWLDAMWRSSGDPKTDATVLENQWQNSGVAPFARSWFAKIVQTEDGRAFLEAARTNPRDTGLTDEARQALFGGVFDTDTFDDDDQRTPDFEVLQRRISDVLSKEGTRIRDVSDILEQMSDAGHRDDALLYGAQWIGNLNSRDTTSALELLNRLQYLSWSDLWFPDGPICSQRQCAHYLSPNVPPGSLCCVTTRCNLFHRMKSNSNCCAGP
jgi:hypothetical protein